MKLAFCPTCERVSYRGLHHAGICSYCHSTTRDVQVSLSPLYVTGILLVVVVSVGAFLTEALALWQKVVVMVAALVGGYALILRGLHRMRYQAWQRGTDQDEEVGA